MQWNSLSEWKTLGRRLEDSTIVRRHLKTHEGSSGVQCTLHTVTYDWCKPYIFRLMKSNEFIGAKILRIWFRISLVGSISLHLSPCYQFAIFRFPVYSVNLTHLSGVCKLKQIGSHRGQIRDEVTSELPKSEPSNLNNRVLSSKSEPHNANFIPIECHRRSHEARFSIPFN